MGMKRCRWSWRLIKPTRSSPLKEGDRARQGLCGLLGGYGRSIAPPPASAGVHSSPARDQTVSMSARGRTCPGRPLARSALRPKRQFGLRPIAGLSARAWDLGPPKGPVERLEHAAIGGDRRSMPDAPISSVIGNRRNAARQQCHGFRLPMRSGLSENALKVAAYGGKPDAHVCGNVLK